jgi:pyruvate formate lyase activating enzyme
MVNGKMTYNIDNCTLCDECIYTCNKNASPKLLSKSNQEILKDISKRKDFIRGVTFSGGEATLQYKKMIPLIKGIKELGLTVFIDSNGYFDMDESFMEFVDLVDKFMIDLKFFDNSKHIYYTGVSNEKIIRNIEHLYKLKKLEEVRTVLYETPNNLDEIKKISELIPNDILYKIIKYHTYGVRKEYLDLFKVPNDKLVKEVEHYLMSSNRLFTII